MSTKGVEIRKPIAGDVPLARALDAMVREGELYEKLDGNRVRCYACAHRCLINDGARGICQVRYNRGGTLFVPHGYVAALNPDPTEKKPFFHILPGSTTLTFGMLGCDLHCANCFTGDVRVVTSKGALPLKEVFALGEKVQRTHDAEIAYPTDLKTIAASGTWRIVRKVFKHHYAGPITLIRPFYLPELRCTPEHRVYAVLNPNDPQPQVIEARALTTAHYLAIPKHYAFSEPQVVDVHAALQPFEATYRVPHEFNTNDIQEIIAASAQGVTSRELGARFGKRADYMRHVRSKVQRGLWRNERVEGVALEDNTVRFWKERRPGIPSVIPLTDSLARLFGYYCAEGSVTKDKSRPNSFDLSFSFGPTEARLAAETQRLMRQVFGIDAPVLQRETTRTVAVSKSSVAVLFQSLCGSRASDKRVPPHFFDAPRNVVESFLDAYIQGDGHRHPNGKISVTTISADLAYGIAYLALKVGYLPSLYENTLPAEKKIQGRLVKQAKRQFTVVWYTSDAVPRRWREAEDYYLVPLREIASENFDGAVYNMEVDEEHNYLANFFLVKNCQNWDISQTLRDADAGRLPERVTPEQIVAIARRTGAQLIGSSYNEPLITSEWAVEVFKVAQQYGLRGVYVSNGNATREVLEYIRPYVVGYKIDLKSMRDKNYRKLGMPLQVVLDSIQRVKEMGFWLEVVTLVIPGFNDSNEELMDAAQYIRSVSPDIPWHVTAFHPDYRMTDTDYTPAATLIRAAEIGQEAGLHYVYAGNLPGYVKNYENTYCPKCNTLLVERYGYRIPQVRVTQEGKCPRCGETIPGIWV